MNCATVITMHWRSLISHYTRFSNDLSNHLQCVHCDSEPSEESHSHPPWGCQDVYQIHSSEEFTQARAAFILDTLWTGCCLMFVYGCSGCDCSRRTRTLTVELCCSVTITSAAQREREKTQRPNSQSGYYAHVLTEMAGIWRLNNNNNRFPPWYHNAMLYTFNSKRNKSSPSSDWSSAMWEECRSPTDEAMMQQVIKSISRVQLPMQTCCGCISRAGRSRVLSAGETLHCTAAAWRQRAVGGRKGRL